MRGNKLKKVEKGNKRKGKMAIDFYYIPQSPPCRAVMILAKAIGVHLNLIVVNLFVGEHMKPEFVKMNPQHCLPTINDNGFILWESRAIMSYLVRKYAKNDTLYPKNPKLKAIVDHRLYFELSYIFLKLQHAVGAILFNLPDDVDHTPDLEKSFEIFDKLLQDSTFIAGDNLTIADFSSVPTVYQANIFGIDIYRYDNVAAWFKRCREHMEKYGFEELVVERGNELQALVNDMKK